MPFRSLCYLATGPFGVARTAKRVHVPGVPSAPDPRRYVIALPQVKLKRSLAQFEEWTLSVNVCALEPLFASDEGL